MGDMMQRGENVWWLYQARRIATQGNVAGGLVVLDIALSAGQVAKLISCHAESNATAHSLYMDINDEDDAQHARLARITGAIASVAVDIPSQGTSATASLNVADTTNLLVGPGQKLVARTNEAGAQNDTLTVAMTLLLSTPTQPTWSKARSANEADVTLAASTISAANTLQRINMP